MPITTVCRANCKDTIGTEERVPSQQVTKQKSFAENGTEPEPERDYQTVTAAVHDTGGKRLIESGATPTKGKRPFKAHQATPGGRAYFLLDSQPKLMVYSGIMSVSVLDFVQTQVSGFSFQVSDTVQPILTASMHDPRSP